MWRYNSINYNDTANAPGFAVSIYLQGCPHHCKGCFNPETWDFNGGQEFTDKLLKNIKEKLYANGIKRSLCILGGEPLHEKNLEVLTNIIAIIPNEIKIYVWTGYTLEELVAKEDLRINWILNHIDYLIDGPFIEEERDITLKMRGSRNQRIWDLKNKIDITNNF